MLERVAESQDRHLTKDERGVTRFINQASKEKSASNDDEHSGRLSLGMGLEFDTAVHMQANPLNSNDALVRGCGVSCACLWECCKLN